MEKFNIVTPKEYEVKGEKKTAWLQNGTLIKLEDGKMFIELNMFPNQKFMVFKQEAREDKKTGDSNGY